MTSAPKERTRVPPVTALRSPPLSRITGALSPVIALFVDRGDTFDDLPIRRDELPSSDEHHVVNAERR